LKKLLYVVNVDWFFVSHRLPIAKAALDQNYQVHLASHFSNPIGEMEGEGIIAHSIKIARSSRSPLGELRCFFSILNVMRKVRPDLVHLVTIKPVIYGGIAARILGIPAVAAIPGLGYSFSSKSLIMRCFQALLIILYRFSVGGTNCQVIVQNRHDFIILRERIGVPPDRMTLIHGSGVAVSSYPVVPELDGPFTVVMAARLLHDKGVHEFVDAARLVKQRHPEVRFLLAGDLDEENPSSLSPIELEAIRKDGMVEHCGYVQDIPALFARAHFVVLPSYREGLPKVLIEAAACGRAVITTSTPGCEDAILPDETGLLVPVRDAKALADAMIRLIEDPQLRHRLGERGRRLAVDRYDIGTVINTHLEIYRSLKALP
jgi:glycosyltransferase involved in cell wall biosynthesis